MKYRTKQFEIEAIQYTGDIEIVKEVFPDAEFKTHLEFGSYVEDMQVWDYLHKTWVTFYEGQYIIKGMKGEFYPCDPEVFETKYEPVLATGGIVRDSKAVFDVDYVIPKEKID